MPELPPLEFEGFDAPQYTQVPDVVFDLLLPYLSEAELKVLLYIIRRTFGFKKNADAISLSQLAEGIVKKDGTRLDYGAGCSRSSVIRGVKGLVEKRIIVAEKQRAPDGDYETTVYRLRLRGWSQFDTTPGFNLTPPVVPGRDGQQTDIQERVLQRDDSNPPARKKTGEGNDRPPYSPYIAQVVLDLSKELGDTQGLSNVTQALRLWEASGLGERAFVEALQAAKRGVRKAQAHGVANKGAYWMAVLRDQLGLQDGAVG